MSDTPAAWQLRQAFAPTPHGIEEAGNATRTLLIDWGLATFAERGEHAATVMASWLALNGPGRGWIQLVVRYDPRQRELLISALDAGSLLPTAHLGDKLGATLAESGGLASGAYRTDGGRRLRCLLGPVKPWSVRYTWRAPRGDHHPQHTYDHFETSEDAERAASATAANRSAAAGFALLAADIEGPGYGEWRTIYELEEP